MPAYLSILRPLNCAMSAVAVWLGALLAGGAVLPGREIVLGMVAVFLISGAGMVVNDIFDIDIDRRNRPKRPLPSGRISIGSAKVYAVVLFAVGNFLGLLLGRQEFYITLLASALLIAYAWKLKKVLFAGHAAVSFLVALSFFFGGLVQGNLLAPLWVGVIAFFANMGREVYKGIEDILGDKSAHVDSIAIRYGAFRAKAIGSAFTVLAVLLSFAPFLTGEMGETYLFFVVLADIAFVAAIGAPARYGSKLSKAGMLIALLAFILGTPQVQALLVG